VVGAPLAPGVCVTVIVVSAFATLVGVYRTTETVSLFSTHGAMRLLECTGGLGTFRVLRGFMAKLTAHIRLASAARRRTKAEHLRDEMREHLRLKEGGVLSAGEYETARVRILDQHSPVVQPPLARTSTPTKCRTPSRRVLPIPPFGARPCHSPMCPFDSLGRATEHTSSLTVPACVCSSSPVARSGGASAISGKARSRCSRWASIPTSPSSKLANGAMMRAASSPAALIRAPSVAHRIPKYVRGRGPRLSRASFPPRARQQALPETLKKATWVLERFVFPALGKRPIGAITAKELLLVLKKIEVQNFHETARHTKQKCGQILRHAVGLGFAERDITMDLRGLLQAPLVEHHASITEPARAGALLRAIDGYHGRLETRGALRLAPLVFVRPGELRSAEWAHVDLEEAQWRIPAHLMKMKRPHIVPLSRQAIAILRELQEWTGKGRFLFPMSTNPDRTMSEATINYALCSIGYSGKEFTGHGFRSMASTLLNERGWDTEAIERQLAHIEGNGVKAAYNYAQHLPTRQKMMQAWADYLDELRALPEPPSLDDPADFAATQKVRQLERIVHTPSAGLPAMIADEDNEPGKAPGLHPVTLLSES
jgi:integrase